MPNEHPSARKITPTRDGKNVTNQKGFTLENMASGLGNSGSNQRYLSQKLSSGKKSASGVKDSGEKPAFLHPQDSLEMQPRKDVLFISQQRKLLTDISDYEA